MERREFIALAAAATFYGFAGWQRAEEVPDPIGPMLKDFFDDCLICANESVVRFSCSEPFDQDAEDAKHRELIQPIRARLGGACCCQLALTTGEHLLRHPRGVAQFMAEFFKKAQADLSPAQCAALGELATQFCRLEGRYEAHADYEHLPICFWLCPATVSAGYWQSEVHGVYQEMETLKSERTEDAADGRVDEFSPDGDVMLPLTDRVYGPRVWLRPHLWEFAGLGARLRREKPELTRSVRVRQAKGLNKQRQQFWTSEVDVLPVFEGFHEEVFAPIVVQQNTDGRARNIGYTDLNLSMVRFFSHHESWLDPSALKLTLAFRPSDLGLMQAATNYGLLEQYLYVTPGLEIALRRALNKAAA